MSLPSSERLPSDINDLPPARQRHIRRQPRAASLAERQILLESLIKATAPTPAFFGRTILGAMVVGTALYLNSLAILVVAIVVLPFQSPLFGLSLFPSTLNVRHAVKSLVSLLVLVILITGAGAAAGLLTGLQYPDVLSLYRFSALYWLDIIIVIVTAWLSALILLRQGTASHGLGVLAAYFLLMPFAVFGFGLSNANLSLWSGALLVGVVQLGLAAVISMIAFSIYGFPPTKSLGWLLMITLLMIILAITSASLSMASNSTATPSTPVAPSPTSLIILTDTPSAQVEPTATVSPIATDVPPTSTWTASPMPTNTPTPSPTVEPTLLWGVIASETGAVIRKEPAFTAEIITYANNGDLIELIGQPITQGGSSWFQVLTKDGQNGWLLGSLVHTQTPAPVDND